MAKYTKARLSDPPETATENLFTLLYLSSISLNLKKTCFIFFCRGGGNIKKKVSLNIVEAIKFAKQKKSLILGVTGPDGGYTNKNADFCLKIPINNKKNITALTESYQSIIWHLIVTHPYLKENSMKWESLI